jgi:hypothetical protein
MKGGGGGGGHHKSWQSQTDTVAVQFRGRTPACLSKLMPAKAWGQGGGGRVRRSRIHGTAQGKVSAVRSTNLDWRMCCQTGCP